MVNISSVNGADSCTSVTFRVVTSSSTRRRKKRYNSRAYSHKYCNKKLFKCFFFIITYFRIDNTCKCFNFFKSAKSSTEKAIGSALIK